MPELSARLVVLLAALAAYTVTTAIFDQRQRRIPNAVTIPMFLAGWVYQLAFGGLQGLADGGLAFLLGFGALFVLWLIGAAGGGDVKLLGGLSVWLGFKMTQHVLVASILFVVVGTIAVFAVGMIRRGPTKLKEKHLATGKKALPRKERRVMPFAVPVALATWTVLALHWPKLF
jgi:prepilin peptidase CpaA